MPLGTTPAAPTAVPEQSAPSEASTAPPIVAAPAGDCSAPSAPRAPLRRLTRFEYNNTVRDLLGIADRPADALPGEELGNGFGNDADVLTVSRLLIDGYRTVAKQIAAELASDAASATELAGCEPTVGDATSCRDPFLERFGSRAYRRPLTPEETSSLAYVFTLGEDLGGDFASGVRAVVEVVLQSPQFLYRIEHGEVADAATSLGRPTSYEMASRLSYLLWGSAPDDELLDLAAQGRLTDRQIVLEQAGRMLDDDRSRDVVKNFHNLLYGIAGVATLERSAEYYPDFEPGMGRLFQQESEAFIDHVVWAGDGTFEALLTAPYTFVNEQLADFYGLRGVTGEAFVQVDVEPGQRGGLLTHASILSLTTPGSRTNPIVRGKWVLQKMLCYTVPDPPVGLMVEEPEVVPGLSTRERFARHRDDPSCSGCHMLLDPIGFGFENYDGVGLWRDEENGAPIDAAGEIPVTDAAGPFSTPVELAARIAQSEAGRNCYVGSWLTYAYGRTEDTGDACTRQALQRDFTVSSGNVKALLTALTQTDAFLYRPLPTSP